MPSHSSTTLNSYNFFILIANSRIIMLVNASSRRFQSRSPSPTLSRSSPSPLRQSFTLIQEDQSESSETRRRHHHHKLNQNQNIRNPQSSEFKQFRAPRLEAPRPLKQSALNRSINSPTSPAQSLIPAPKAAPRHKALSLKPASPVSQQRLYQRKDTLTRPASPLPRLLLSPTPSIKQKQHSSSPPPTMTPLSPSVTSRSTSPPPRSILKSPETGIFKSLTRKMTKALKRRPIRKVSFNVVTIERQVEDFFADIEIEDVSAAESTYRDQINYDADIDSDEDLDDEEERAELNVEQIMDVPVIETVKNDVSRPRSPSSPGSSPLPQIMQRVKSKIAPKALTINTELNADNSRGSIIALKVRNLLEESVKDESFVNLISPNPLEKTRQLEIIFGPSTQLPTIPLSDLPSLSRSPVPRLRRRVDSMASNASDDTVIESVLIPSPIFSSKSGSLKLDDPVYLAALKARRQRLQMLMLGIGDESTDLFDAALVISETPLSGERE
jgi:hypothetical protein